MKKGGWKKDRISEDKLRFAVLATDILLLSFHEGNLLARFVKVNRPPFFNNIWGLPGGLIDPKETALESAKRILSSKAGINTDKAYLEQLYTFSEIDRDPRGRVVSVAYLGLIPWNDLSNEAKKDSSEYSWKVLPFNSKLAYDHNQILKVGLERLMSRITYTTLISKIMPSEFTLTELEKTYETILGHSIDRRNFRKKINRIEILKELNKERRGFKWRPAKLYSFVSKTVIPIEVI